MSFSIGSGGVGGSNVVKTTTAAAGGGFSFPTLTPTTASGGTSGFSFGTAVSSQPTGTSPFSFGTNTLQGAATTTTATGGFFSTPASTSTFSFSAPATTSTSAFSFSAPATTTTVSAEFSAGFQLPSTTIASTAAISSPFGLQTKPQGVATAEATKSAITTLSFSAKPAAAPGSTLLAPPTTSTTATAAAITTTASATTTTAPAPPTGFPTLLTGQSSAPSTTTAGLGTTTATTAVAATAIASLPTSTPILASLTTATSTSSAASALTVAGATPGLSVAGLEEKVNKWMSEMREQEERLMRQAAHVNAWDQLLQQGHDQVQHLRHTLNNVKTDQNRLQAELDFIQGQQQELEQLIEPLEAAAASTTPAQHQGDRQRENMHLVAQNLDSQLRQITDDLCKVIEHLNSSNSGSHASDPVNTVARVLSAHMDTLKWVDQNCALLTQKIDELSRASDSKHRE